MRTFLFSVTAFLCAVIAIAQLQETVEVDLVEVYVSALDRNGSPVEDLSEKDFVLKEDGAVQKITYFSRLIDPDSQIPLTIGFLVDTSGSMQKRNNKLRRIDLAKAFATLFLKEVKPGDTIQVLAFDNVFRSLSPMTSDVAKINQALSEVQIDVHSNPSTALLVATDLAAKYLEPYTGRKILIVCSDGQNNAPGPTREELIESLKRRDVTVLSLATLNDLDRESGSQIDQYDSPSGDGINSMSVQRGPTSDSKKAKDLMKHLAEETGGYAFFPDQTSELNEAILKLRSVIRSQYALSYKPPHHAKNSWRKIDVKCKRKDVKLRFRQGYYN